MVCKKGQFDVVELILNQFKAFSINLNAQHVNGMTQSWLLHSSILRNGRCAKCGIF